jgi:hypothetical protein
MLKARDDVMRGPREGWCRIKKSCRIEDDVLQDENAKRTHNAEGNWELEINAVTRKKKSEGEIIA